MTQQAAPHFPTLPQLFLKFLRFGLLAFGGPVAQIAMIREALVEDEGWISSARFNRLLAVMQVLPGPEAHELCVHMGMIARGRIGGLLAGLGFMLPGFALMLAAAWAYDEWLASGTAMASAFFGVQLVVLAIILRAIERIGRHVLEDRMLWLLAGLAFGATLAGVPFWIPLIASGLAYIVSDRPWMLALIGAAALLLTLLVPYVHAIGLSAALTPSRATTAALFVAGLKGGLLTFGGAYTAIPYVRADTVERGWLSDGTFLDGVAVAGVLPAPLVIFATFAGYMAGGWSGAVAITAGIFLPAFAFSLIFFERLEAAVENPALHRMLTGIAAAVVGVIAATLVLLGTSTAARASNVGVAVTIFAVAAALIWNARGSARTPAIIAAGAAAGWLFAP